MISRIFSNTKKQISRSGWVAWSSVAIMALAFFVATIFGGLAYLSNLFIQFVETKDNVLVFFEVGTEESIVGELRTKWEAMPEIKKIDFTSEEQAYSLYLAETEYTMPVEHQLLQEFEDEQKLLPSSLDIQLYNLQDLSKVKDTLLSDIEKQLETMEYDPNSVPIDLRIDDETLQELRVVFSFLRIGGAVVLSLLFVIIFFFTLMTVEFRTFNRMEEIGVMQLVGGSLWYIRAPYILEGGFYGLAGALISSILIGGVGIAVFLVDPSSVLSVFLRERLQVLPLPYITAFGWLAIIGILSFMGFAVGSISSYLAIRKYIK